MHNTSTTISDTNGKGKEKEAHPSPQASNVHPDVEEDTWGQYPLESFPSPPADGFCHVRQSNDNDPTPSTVPNTDAFQKFNPPLDPPLMTLTYPPVANDPKWYANMFSEVHRHRDHLNKQLQLAQSEAVAALAEVTLAQIELSAEMGQMQTFLDHMAFVAGKNFVHKLLNSVQWVMENGEESEEERQDADADDEDSNGGDEERQDDAKNDNPSSSGDESEGDEQSSGDEKSCGACAESRERSKNGSRKRPLEEEEEEEEEANPHSTPQKVQKILDNGTCISDDDAKSRRSSRSPSRKRPREEDENEDEARKKFKEEAVAESNFTSTQHYGGAGDDDGDEPASQHLWSPEDDEVDPEPNSDEEYEVEDSLLLVEYEPTLAGPSTGMPRSLLEISRDPHRLRQNSRGEPELYIPG